jgi:hypothetical protein
MSSPSWPWPLAPHWATLWLHQGISLSSSSDFAHPPRTQTRWPLQLPHSLLAIPCSLLAGPLHILRSCDCNGCPTCPGLVSRYSPPSGMAGVLLSACPQRTGTNWVPGGLNTMSPPQTISGSTISDLKGFSESSMTPQARKECRRCQAWCHANMQKEWPVTERG